MRLYTYFRSSAAYRVRIALAYKDIAYESLPVRLLGKDGDQHASIYLQRNPQGLVPACDIGDTVLAQSLAIMEYLEEIRPTPALLPRDPVARAQVRAMALNIACDIHPLNNLRVLEYLRGPLAQPDTAVRAWYGHWIAIGFRGLEQLARRHSTQSRHLFGDSVTLADVCLVPQMVNARRFHCDVTPYPTLVAIDAHLATHPAFTASHPDLQPDAQA
jgi:maleylacetoacetate isomerase